MSSFVEHVTRASFHKPLDMKTVSLGFSDAQRRTLHGRRPVPTDGIRLNGREEMVNGSEHEFGFIWKKDNKLLVSVIPMENYSGHGTCDLSWGSVEPIGRAFL